MARPVRNTGAGAGEVGESSFGWYGLGPASALLRFAPSPTPAAGAAGFALLPTSERGARSSFEVQAFASAFSSRLGLAEARGVL